MKIEYKGKQIPLKISYYAIKMFQEETKRSLNEIGEDIALIEVLVWYGIVAGHKALGLENPIKREEVEWILDESMNDIMESINGQQVITADSKKKP